MEKTAIAPGANKLKLKFTTAERHLGHFNRFGDDMKKLQTGIGFSVITENGKSWEIENASMTFRPSKEMIFLYAKCPIAGGKGELVKANTSLFDTETHYLILVRNAHYSDLKF